MILQEDFTFSNGVKISKLAAEVKSYKKAVSSIDKALKAMSSLISI